MLADFPNLRHLTYSHKNLRCNSFGRTLCGYSHTAKSSHHTWTFPGPTSLTQPLEIKYDFRINKHGVRRRKALVKGVETAWAWTVLPTSWYGHELLLFFPIEMLRFAFWLGTHHSQQAAHTRRIRAKQSKKLNIPDLWSEPPQCPPDQTRTVWKHHTWQENRMRFLLEPLPQSECL